MALLNEHCQEHILESLGIDRLRIREELLELGSMYTRARHYYSDPPICDAMSANDKKELDKLYQFMGELERCLVDLQNLADPSWGEEEEDEERD